jgi:hypothetical protein
MLEIKYAKFEREKREVLKLENITFAISSVFQRRKSMLSVSMQAFIEHAF